MQHSYKPTIASARVPLKGQLCVDILLGATLLLTSLQNIQAD